MKNRNEKKISTVHIDVISMIKKFSILIKVFRNFKFIANTLLFKIIQTLIYF